MHLKLVALTLAAAIAGTTAFAGDDGKHAGRGKSAFRVLCPHCGDACYPTVTKGKETKTCWDVEAKTICIPRVRFPWEADCAKGDGKNECPAPKCGRTRSVNVLMKHEYECSTCEYSWDVDGYKNGNGKKGSVPTGEPIEADPSVNEPPPVEARLPHSNRRIAPAVFLQSRPVPAPSIEKSYADLLISLFK